MSISLPSGPIWQNFVRFFREEKGYEDWTEDEIELSYNDDDVQAFMLWLCNQNEALRLELDGYKIDTEHLQRIADAPDNKLKAKLVIENVYGADYFECDENGDIKDYRPELMSLDEPFDAEYQIWLGDDESGYSYDQSFPLNKLEEAVRLVKAINKSKYI